MKNDKKQLKGILNEFDLGQAQVVLSELCSELMPKSSEFKNQGGLCSNGQDGCIGEKEFARTQEAMWVKTISCQHISSRKGLKFKKQLLW